MRSVITVAALAGLCACAQEPEPQPEPQPQPAVEERSPQVRPAPARPGSLTLASAPTPLDTGPISYFETHCARCHGGYGSLYAFPFITPDDELTQVVKDMCAGPAMAPLDGRPLEALVDYHIAMRDKADFLALVGRDARGLDIELTPGASLHFVSGDGVAKLIEGDTWRVEPLSERFTLEVRRGDQVLEVTAWPKQAWGAAE